MEWVETTSKSVDEAKDLLLDRLGVDEDEAEFEVLEEPRPGLFGRPRGVARVRARVMPKAPRSKTERRPKRGGRRGGERTGSKGASSKETSSEPADQPAAAAVSSGNGAATADEPAERPRRSSGNGAPKKAPRNGESGRSGGGRDGGPSEAADPEVIAATVKEFLTGLVDAFGVEATTEVAVTDGEVHANIAGEGLGALIGPRGGVIDALQELSRTASQKEAKGRSVPKIRVDVASVRERRRAELESFARQVAEQVRDSGETHAFEPMGSIDRKVVHDAATSVEGVVTVSEGEDPSRKVVVQRA